MHRSAVTNAIVTNHCNAFVSSLIVSSLPSFNEHIFKKTTLSDYFQT